MDRRVESYLHEHQSRFLAELMDLLRIPSISAQPEHRPDMERAAKFLLDQFTGMGLAAEIVPTAGHPIVYAEWLGRPGAPTVLIYGHYDVQPPDPLDQWTTPPFEPTIRDGKIYARGATDDKGQFFTHLKGVEAWLRATGSLPVNVKFVIEGEEEVGGANLDRFLEANREKLACDVVVVSDGSQYAPGMPAINYGLRGILAAEITIHGPEQDLHSGIFGGSVMNPAVALCRLIATLHDDQGRIQIPGFYDRVRPLSDAERRAFARLPFDDSKYGREIGVSGLFGEVGYTTLERRWARPTCEVNGLSAGYQGVGPKTIIPGSATVKLTCRLVPDQDPVELSNALERHVRKACAPGVRLSYRDYHGCRPFAFNPHHPWITLANDALKTGFGAAPVLIRDGGSIPVVLTFKEVLGVDTLLLGWGQESDGMHAPNEHFLIDDFHRGCFTAAHLLPRLSQGPQSSRGAVNEAIME